MTISIHSTPRTASSPGQYFDLGTRWTLITASVDARAPSNFPSSRLAGIFLRVHNYEQQTDSQIESSPFNYSNGRLPAPGNHSRLAGPPVIFCYHIGITFRSRSLVVFFQLRSVSCAPFTPTFADGVVQRSLALYLPCFVSLCSPVWPRAISHRTHPIFTTNHKIPFLYYHP